MATEWTNEAGALAKRAYPTDVVESVVNTAVETYKKVTKTMKLEGEGEFLPVKLYGNESGQGNIAEDGQLPAGGSQTVKQGQAKPKVFTHVIKYTGLSLKMLQSKRAAFANTMMFQIEEGIKDASKEINAQAFRDGTNLLATAAQASASGNDLTIDNNIPTHFRPGMLISSATGTNPEEVVSVEMPNAANGTYTVTLKAAASGIAGADIYRKDEKDLGFEGLPNITATSGTCMNIAKATFPTWKGLEVSSGGSNLSESMLLKAKGLMKISKGTKPNCLISNDSQFRMYMAETTPQVRYEAGKRDSHPDVKYYWNSMEWIVDADCPLDEVYLFDKNQFMLFENTPLGLDDSKGGVLRFVDSYDSYVTLIKTYGNYGTQNTGSFVRLHTLNVPAIV